jgi:hypothetical protein
VAIPDVERKRGSTALSFGTFCLPYCNRLALGTEGSIATDLHYLIATDLH